MAKGEGIDRPLTKSELRRLAKARTKAANANARSARAAKREIDAQKRKLNIEARYGRARKPAPVTVKRLDTGEVTVMSQKAFRLQAARRANGR